MTRESTTETQTEQPAAHIWNLMGYIPPKKQLWSLKDMKYAWVTKRKCCFQRAGSFHTEQRDVMNKWRAVFTPNMQRVDARLYLYSQKKPHCYWIVRFLLDQSGNCFGRHHVIRWKNQWSTQTDWLRCVPFGEHLRSRVRNISTVKPEKCFSGHVLCKTPWGGFTHLVTLLNNVPVLVSPAHMDQDRHAHAELWHDAHSCQ